MKRLFLTAFMLLLSGAVWAASCKTDVGGTWKTNQPELAPHTSIACEGCREVNAFPQDIRNFMWNWVVLGRGGTLTPGTDSLGNYILWSRLSQEFTVTPIFGNQPGNNVMSMPIANDHGQSATATIEVVHNMLSVWQSRGFMLGINTGIKEFIITVTNSDGSQIKSTYDVLKMEAELKIPGYKMPVPANTKADKAKKGDCLNNAGEKRPPDSEMKPVPTNPTSDVSGAVQRSYEDMSWWEEEEAYGRRHPELRCGTSYAGETSRTTCGWFWF